MGSRRVACSIWRLEIAKWKGTCLLYGGLQMYRSIVINISMHVWWRIASKIPYKLRQISGVMSILMNSQPQGLFCTRNRNRCPLCESVSSESIQHILFECLNIKKYIRTLNR